MGGKEIPDQYNLSCLLLVLVSLMLDCRASHTHTHRHSVTNVLPLALSEDLWRNQSWQWFEKGCRKLMLGVLAQGRDHRA